MPCWWASKQLCNRHTSVKHILETRNVQSWEWHKFLDMYDFCYHIYHFFTCENTSKSWKPNRFWQRSLEQLWFLWSIVTMERVPLLDHWAQRICDIFHQNKHYLIWLFSDSIIRQVPSQSFTPFLTGKFQLGREIGSFIAKLRIHREDCVPQLSWEKGLECGIILLLYLLVLASVI